MRSLAAVVIGIGTYRYDQSSFPVLRYAAKDADEFVLYLKTCWPKAEDMELAHVEEQDADLEALVRAVNRLSQRGPYDLQIVFLSGHGLLDSQRTGFVLQPTANSSQVSLLEPAILDRLLASVPAKRTILILDCCYAEGITRSMRFFAGLDASDARLFIASSRQQQLTWEDDGVGHGIFTAHLLDLLRTGSSVGLGGERDQLDVDSELFPVLCDQVPLYVFEHKEQRQEPVKGGISMRSVKLPVARAARRIRERTAFGTALRRLQQIVISAAMGGVAFLFFAYTLGYYAEADRNGDVRIHHGTRWLAPALRFLPSLRVDSGISFSDLSDDPANRFPVQSGEIWGFWTQMSRQDIRSWYDSVRPSLDATAAAKYDVLVGNDASRPVYRLTDESRPSEIAFAGWALLDGSDPNQLKTLLGHVVGADRVTPILKPFSAADMDFNILDLTQPELGSYADALRSAAVIDPDQTFLAYLGFLKANQIWLAHSSKEQHGSEAQRRAADDVADVLAVIAKARSDRGEPALDETMVSQLNGLANIGYGDLVQPALSRVSRTAAEKKAAAEHALVSFHGNSAETSQASALVQLKDSLDGSTDSQQIVAAVHQRFMAVGGPEQSDLTAFLIAAADQKALPPSLVTTLLGKAREAIHRRNDEFVDIEYARILAHGMSEVPTDSRPLVYELIKKVTTSVTPLASSTAEIYTALGRQSLETPQMYQQIVAQAKAAPPYKPESPSIVAEPLPGMSIVVGHGPWLDALAVLAANRQVSSQEIEILEAHANDPSLRSEIIRALVHQQGLFSDTCWKTSCGRDLAAYPDNGTLRTLASDVIAERLAALPRIEFLSALAKLGAERAGETEPEVRIALGLTRINAQLARVRTIRVGDRLFE
jgi:hypothetical protein